MQFVSTRIDGVVLIKPKLFGDNRGFFMETWQEEKFAAAGISEKFVQDNHSRSSKWTLRGMHYQIQQPQGKLVRVVRGSVFDVAVDLRASSRTFGRWVGVELDDRDNHMLWVPPGFAHGFLALSDDVDLVYKCTAFYAPQHERVIAWNDQRVGIDWPLPSGVQPLLAPKDEVATTIDRADVFP